MLKETLKKVLGVFVAVIMVVGTMPAKANAEKESSKTHTNGNERLYVWDNVNKTKIMLGDVRNDSVVDVRDLVRLYKYQEGKTAEITEVAADINFDDQLNSEDIGLLRIQLLDNDIYWSNVY